MNGTVSLVIVAIGLVVITITGVYYLAGGVVKSVDMAPRDLNQRFRRLWLFGFSLGIGLWIGGGVSWWVIGITSGNGFISLVAGLVAATIAVYGYLVYMNLLYRRRNRARPPRWQ